MEKTDKLTVGKPFKIWAKNKDGSNPIEKHTSKAGKPYYTASLFQSIYLGKGEDGKANFKTVYCNAVIFDEGVAERLSAYLDNCGGKIGEINLDATVSSVVIDNFSVVESDNNGSPF